MPVRFGNFELHEGRRQLLRCGEPLAISAKQFLLLKLLIERRPNAVPKRELYDRLWPATFVSDGNLPGLIAELRAALEDDSRDPRFIRTVHGFGYAFCGTIDGSTQPANESYMASLVGNEWTLRIGQEETVIGRDPSLRCVVDDPSISRRHAVVTCDNSSFFIRDLDSKNGTFVGGVRVADRREIVEGDVITLGKVRLVFHRAPAATTITAGFDEGR